MVLRDTYSRFLATPSAGALAENASLNYITTNTSISNATAIIKHLSVQEKLLKKTKQKILDAIEDGHHGLSVDVETTIEFQSGGGAYLPGLDDNFVADRTVTFPMVHMVRFDKAGKITQIRQYWDQGSLLKQIDVIGARSRNWPIRDGSEQLRLIVSSAAAVEYPESSRPPTAASRGTDEVSIASRGRASTKNAMNDPHASLSLFQPRQIDDEEPPISQQPIAPRATSAKPPPREYNELFAGADGPSPSPSPQKIPVKAGSNKKFGANRLFEEFDDHSTAAAPQSIKTNNKKYDHFTFGEGEETPKTRGINIAGNGMGGRKGTEEAWALNRNRNDAHWDFETFNTPDKAKTKELPQAVRHFGWSDDEETSPVRRPIVHKARPDADPHFEFVDDGTPEAQRRQAPTKGGRSNKGQGLYEDHVTDTADDGAATGDIERPLNDVTTATRNKNRSQFEINDISPGAGKTMPSHETRSSMHTHWGTHQDSPDGRGINIAGNGMGARKGTEAAWSLFDESPAKENSNNTGARAGIKTEGDGMGGRKTADKSFWDF